LLEWKTREVVLTDNVRRITCEESGTYLVYDDRRGWLRREVSGGIVVFEEPEIPYGIDLMGWTDE